MASVAHSSSKYDALSLEGCANAYLESIRAQNRYSKSTLLAYQTDLYNFTEYLYKTLGQDPAISDFNVEQVASFLESERLAGYKRSTLKRRMAVLRGLEAYLRKNLGFNINFFATQSKNLVEPIERIQLTKSQQVLAPTEIERLAQAMEASRRPRARRDHAIFALLLETGLSVGKLVELDITDLQAREGLLSLRFTPEHKQWLPLKSATPMLRRYLTEGRPELNPLPNENALFVSQSGIRMSRQGVWQVLRYWGRAINLSVSLSPRLVRNTATETLVKTKRPLSEIKNLLGHKNHLSTLAMVKRLDLDYP